MTHLRQSFVATYWSNYVTCRKIPATNTHTESVWKTQSQDKIQGPEINVVGTKVLSKFQDGIFLIEVLLCPFSPFSGILNVLILKYSK